LEFELSESIKLDGYTRNRYEMLREAGSIVPAYVLIPDPDLYNGRTVICPHGHGQDDKIVAGVCPPKKPYGNWFGKFTGNYAERLAQNGFITATWSERALSAERRDLNPLKNGDQCNIANMCAQAMSMTLPKLQTPTLRGWA
jgi:hypothetical protein